MIAPQLAQRDCCASFGADSAGRISACLDPGMVAPGRHGGHVGEDLPFDVFFRSCWIAARLPRNHPGEPLIEGPECAAVICAVAAVPAALDGHAATFTA